MVPVGIAPVCCPESAFRLGFYLPHRSTNAYHTAMGKYRLAGAPFKAHKKSLPALVTFIQAS